ncbi:methyltransferase domain-containing protein [Winogradskyella sp. 3972H.M.0a.05]|uniref:class I SAM-dependent methyltransferase n=1 Tax=Winogradskyella sp. 3972H.M.0a.05 TaxID=2950277 RepID=UPI0033931D8D
MKLINLKDNKAFKKEFPNVPIPPDYTLYEAHYLNYRGYYNDGLTNAKILKTQFEAHTDFKEKKVLDWGCGPARIIRHFSELCPDADFYGTDYNKSTIAWNRANIKNVTFESNEVNPPTVFEDNFFNAVYSLSVLTHLSKANHYSWIEELWRITKHNAILIISTHGEAFKEKLIPSDKATFENNDLVVQANTLEGHRTYAAYHPPKFMLDLFLNKFEVLEHLPGKVETWGISQDKWILKCIK